MARRITTILSDIGNVVALHDEDVALAAIGTMTGRTMREVQNAIFGDGKDQRKPFRAFMRGRFDADEFRLRVSRALDRKRPLPKAWFEKAFCDIFTLNRPVLDLWRALRKRGLTVTAVSNIEALRAAHLEKMGALKVFDHRVMSYEEGHLKPSRELMIRALELSGAAAEQAVFIDDKPKNMPPASRLGIRTHIYRDFRRLSAFLADNGIKI